MSDTPRMVIVPAHHEPPAVKAIMNATGCGPKDALWAWSDAVAASPNAGKISRADLERAMEVADHAYAASPGPTTELNRIWQDAFADALGLQIAEDGENG